MNVKEQYWKYSLVTIIVVLGTILSVSYTHLTLPTTPYV